MSKTSSRHQQHQRARRRHAARAAREERFGVIDAAPLLLIDVATDQGITGRS